MIPEKQIKEMAKILRDANGKEYPDNYFIADAKVLYRAGYLKASEVAREIFEEIKASAKVKYWRGGGLVVFEINGEDFAELKKKYTQEK